MASTPLAVAENGALFAIVPLGGGTYQLMPVKGADNGDGTATLATSGSGGSSGTASTVTLDGAPATSYTPDAGASGDMGILSSIANRIAAKIKSVITDPTSGAQASVATFHAGDAQTVGSGTTSSLLTAGVAQLVDPVSLVDRQRATGLDGVPALGIASGTAQLASPFATTATAPGTIAKGSSPAGSAGVAVTLAALSGTNRGAAWSVQQGTVAMIDTGANAEAVYVLSVTSTTATVVFGSAGALFAHSAPFAFAANVYNQARDATTPDGSTGQGFAAGATYLLNSNLNGGQGGWEGERSAAGELDNASGVGTAVAAEYEFNGTGFDRGRNLQGKGTTATTLGVAVAAAGTSVTLATAAGLRPGQALFLEPGTANAETVYVSPAFSPTSAANAVVPITTTQFAHASAAVAKYSRTAVGGPGLAEVLPDGIDVAEDIVFARTANGGLGGYYVDTAADADGISPFNVPEEAIGLVNPAGTLDRLSGSPAGTSLASGKTVPGVQGVTNGVPMPVTMPLANANAKIAAAVAAGAIVTAATGVAHLYSLTVEPLPNGTSTAATRITDGPGGALLALIPANHPGGEILTIAKFFGTSVYSNSTTGASGSPAFTIGVGP